MENSDDGNYAYERRVTRGRREFCGLCETSIVLKLPPFVPYAVWLSGGLDVVATQDKTQHGREVVDAIAAYMEAPAWEHDHEAYLERELNRRKAEADAAACLVDEVTEELLKHRQELAARKLGRKAT